MVDFGGISHLDLSVSDVESSAKWYERVLGLRRVRRVDFDSRTMIVLVHDATSLVIGLNQHHGHGERFDERRSGLDHVGFAVARREDLDGWEARLAELDVHHSPVADGAAGSALVLRDPDNIQLEFWWTKPPASET
jgi:glyoxylase I family protein